MPDDEEHGRTPFDSWARRAPIPPAAERAAFRAVAKAPWALWRVTGTDPLTVADATGLSPRWTPEGPVVGAPRAFVPLVEGAAIVARLVPVGEDWHVALGVVLPDVAPAAVVRRGVADAVARAGGAPIEEALASHGHVLVRRLVERWWRQRTTAGR